MITLDVVATTATPGARARAAASLIDQSRREIEAARLIQRGAINELLMHGACGHQHAGPETGGICVGCPCEGVKA